MRHDPNRNDVTPTYRNHCFVTWVMRRSVHRRLEKHTICPVRQFVQLLRPLCSIRQVWIVVVGIPAARARPTTRRLFNALPSKESREDLGRIYCSLNYAALGKRKASVLILHSSGATTRQSNIRLDLTYSSGHLCQYPKEQNCATKCQGSVHARN